MAATNDVPATKLVLDTYASRRWDKWEPMCLPACDECFTHGGYACRNAYVVDWVNMYVENEESIASGCAIMPRISWCTSREASNPDKASVAEMQCSLEEVRFCAIAFPDTTQNPTSDVYGLRSCLGRYRRIRRQRNNERAAAENKRKKNIPKEPLVDREMCIL